jgi:hypothetical protein
MLAGKEAKAGAAWSGAGLAIAQQLQLILRSKVEVSNVGCQPTVRPIQGR